MKFPRLKRLSTRYDKKLLFQKYVTRTNLILMLEEQPVQDQNPGQVER